MNTSELFEDFAKRPVEAARALPELNSRELNAHPGDHPNSIAWLLWHSGREVDVQLSGLSGEPQIWENYRERFDVGEIGDQLGYGHTAQEAAAITVDDQQLLVEYLEAALNALGAYASGLDDGAWDDIVDENWNPAVTRGARLVSIVDDAAQHVGQAAYAAGIIKP